jgi:hypothetical protein
MVTYVQGFRDFRNKPKFAVIGPVKWVVQCGRRRGQKAGASTIQDPLERVLQLQHTHTHTHTIHFSPRRSTCAMTQEAANDVLCFWAVIQRCEVRFLPQADLFLASRHGIIRMLPKRQRVEHQARQREQVGLEQLRVSLLTGVTAGSCRRRRTLQSTKNSLTAPSCAVF